MSCPAAARCGGCRKNKFSVQRGKYPSGAQGRGAGAVSSRRTSGNILVQRGALSPERGVSARSHRALLRTNEKPTQRKRKPEHSSPHHGGCCFDDVSEFFNDHSRYFRCDGGRARRRGANQRPVGPRREPQPARALLLDDDGRPAVAVDAAGRAQDRAADQRRRQPRTGRPNTGTSTTVSSQKLWSRISEAFPSGC